MSSLTMYAVRNKGKWADKSGGSVYWVMYLSSAKIFSNISQARSVMTYCKKNCGVSSPELVKLTLTEECVLDETERLKDAVEKSKKRDKRQTQRAKELALKCTQDRLEKAAKEIREMEEAIEKKEYKMDSGEVRQIRDSEIPFMLKCLERNKERLQELKDLKNESK